MAGIRKSGGSNVSLTTRKRRSGAGWVDITIAKRRSGGVWVDLFPASGSAFLSNRTVSHTVFDPNDAFVGYRVNSDGDVYRLSTSFDTPNFLETWMLSGPASDYEIRPTHVSGTVPSGPAMASWHNLGTTREWKLSQTTPGTNSGVIDVEIRLAGGDGTILASARITITAQVN